MACRSIAFLVVFLLCIRLLLLRKLLFWMHLLYMVLYVHSTVMSCPGTASACLNLPPSVLVVQIPTLVYVPFVHVYCNVPLHCLLHTLW